MLLIGDIHITTKYTDAIIDTIRGFVEKNSDEKNIIFLGDYMYMFSYDRKALSQLFDLFITFWQQGKNLYILAGNHDWIGQQFVYAEGKKISDMVKGSGEKKVHFITSPELHTIEGKEILFFPFTKNLIAQNTVNENNDGEFNAQMMDLLRSKNSNERLSGELNLLLHSYVEKQKELTVIHHYYIADTKFPGQQAIFSYKDIALSPYFLDNKNIQLLSGHIHMPFSYKNYFCAGSVRYTSPLEQDHHKFLYQRNTASNVIKAQQVAINPYITLALQDNEIVKKETIEAHKKNIDQKIKDNFLGKWSLSSIPTEYPLSNTQVTLLSESVGYDTLQQHIEPELLHIVKDWSVKRKTSISPDLSFTLEVAQKNLQESLVDRKIIVKNFIMSRFGEDFEKYRTLLDELHILS